MSELQKGERVRCWPGSKQGRSYLAEVISDGIVEFGGTKCYRVSNIATGGTDYMAATHVVSLTDYQLGQRVRFAEHIKRTAKQWNDTTKPDRYWTGESYPGARHAGGEGIVIGKRTLSDGNVCYMGEEGNVYEQTRTFTAYLIVTGLHSAPVHVLPEHITALD